MDVNDDPDAEDDGIPEESEDDENPHSISEISSLSVWISICSLLLLL